MRFLAIDDDTDTLRLLEVILSKHGTVSSARNGKEAIELFEEAHQKNNPFQLVFLDIMMPGLDGHDVLKIIRNLEESKYSDKPRAKVAMLTALGNHKTRFASYEEGCEYYLVKPIIRAEISNIIEKTREWFDLLDPT